MNNSEEAYMIREAVDRLTETVRDVVKELSNLRETIEKVAEDGRRPAPRIPGMGGG